MLQRRPGLLPMALVHRWRARLDGQAGGSLKLAQALDLDEVLLALRALRSELPGRPRVLTGQCWARRAQPPHHWHQDGALHHDFIARPTGVPLPMWTLWIPLTPCGIDAPGLAWVQPSLDHLLAPDELSHDRVVARFGTPCIEHPALAAGEGLLFDGGLLHRSHVNPAMTRPRTSIELRFFIGDAVPEALAGEPLHDWK
jgi:ectoine hydroxylase-related dioxygenase (phytanoyl-CoA dioxygenase family)